MASKYGADCVKAILASDWLHVAGWSDVAEQAQDILEVISLANPPNLSNLNMADRLTQLQDAVDQLAHQFVASLYYVNTHHDLQTLSATDTVRQDKKADSEAAQRDREVDAYPADVFTAGQVELAQDLIIKEQQIEFLISVLPGLENSETDQEETIRRLEEELRIAEEQRKVAVKEKDVVLARLEDVIRMVKRP